MPPSLQAEVIISTDSAVAYTREIVSVDLEKTPAANTPRISMDTLSGANTSEMDDHDSSLDTQLTTFRPSVKQPPLVLSTIVTTSNSPMPSQQPDNGRFPYFSAEPLSILGFTTTKTAYLPRGPARTKLSTFTSNRSIDMPLEPGPSVLRPSETDPLKTGSLPRKSEGARR